MLSVLYSCRILMKLEFCRQEFRQILTTNFMKIRQVGAEFSVRTDGQTDMDEADSRFSQFCVRMCLKSVLLF